ncbi:MAG: hypothetical protein K8M05_37910 [Deltaproteobacteria bacterium]|nr:hypothetical protein [Kofleriaceae bacterium]
MRSSPAIPILLLFGACTDATPDPDPDLEVPIVGSWRQRLPQGERPDIDHIGDVVFHADGTVTGTRIPPGAYETDGGRLRLISEGGARYRETDYARRNELLVIHGLRPVGEVVELVGVWRGVEIYVDSDEHVEAHWGLELRADGTARYTLSNTDQDFDREGTWTLHIDGWWLLFQATDGDPAGPLGLYFAILGDTALGKYSFMNID